MPESLEQKFANLYDKYHSAIFRFVRLKLPTEEVAQDITSEAFLRAWRSFYELQKSPKNERAYLYRIARNCVIDHYRANRELPTEEHSLVYHIDKVNSDSTIASSLQDKQDVEQIYRVLKNMRQSEAELVILRYIEELSVAETARIVNKSTVSVRVGTHRAVNKLRKLLGDL